MNLRREMMGIFFGGNEKMERGWWEGFKLPLSETRLVDGVVLQCKSALGTIIL